MKSYLKQAICLFFSLLFLALLLDSACAAVYEVGPGLTYERIGQVPWNSLGPGDKVLIHYKASPYHEKWVIARAGTAENPIVVKGVPGPSGQLPIIDGNNAVTSQSLNFWSEERGIINIGGSNIGSQFPRNIVIENLDIRNARPPYTFKDDHGSTKTYSKNASAIYVIEGEGITIRNCRIHNCGNGLFACHASGSIVIEYCHIFDNGIEGSYYQHNTYTEAKGIVYQFNHFGPLRDGCGGNNLKDRSAGTVIRYNWIEGGNRQLDLVDSDYQELIGLPSYRKTFVYGNVLFERGNDGNSQIVHYGGDSGELSRYRKGTLYFYNNTVVSKRTSNTTIFRLSSQDETCIATNNIFFVTAPGGHLAISNRDGTVKLKNNWLKAGWVKSHEGSGFSGKIVDLGGDISGDDPGFVSLSSMDLGLAQGSSCVNAGTDSIPGASPDHPVNFQYRKHQAAEPRPKAGAMDIGAFERAQVQSNRNPVIDSFTAVPVTVSNPGVFIQFSAQANDPDGDNLVYRIEFGDGTVDFKKNPGHRYWKKGQYHVVLTVSDGKGGEAKRALDVTVNDKLPSPPKKLSGKKK